MQYTGSQQKIELHDNKLLFFSFSKEQWESLLCDMKKYFSQFASVL